MLALQNGRRLLVGTSLALMLAAPALAQTPAYIVPHTSWGAPDLQGFWTNASITKMSRPAGVNTLVLTPEEAKAIENKDFNNQRLAADQLPTDQTRGAPKAGNLQANGNYNAFWWDPGQTVAKIHGEYRSSWITEPSTGRIPYKAGRITRPAPAAATTTPAARTGAPARPAAAPTRPTARPAPAKGKAAPKKPVDDKNAFEEPGPSYGGVGTERAESGASYAGPESRSLGERCLIGFGGTGGPVMNNVLYNNAYQIVQSPGAVMILVEMNHDARIIPIVANAAAASASHRPGAIKQWLGDSVGWYEGDTLVVETRNVNPVQRGYISANGKLTERFTRESDGAIVYGFEVDDPDQYSQVWKGEIAFTALKGGLYEYACHEGNYGLIGILEGARQQEKRGKTLEATADSE
jgi:hypothetical protein